MEKQKRNTSSNITNHFIKVDGQYYVDITWCYREFDEAVKLAEDLEKDRIELDSKSTTVFKWGKPEELYFAISVTWFGIHSLDIAKLTEVMNRKYEITSRQVSSRLEKYKLELKRDYELSSTDEIAPQMIPKELECYEELVDLAFRQLMDKQHKHIEELYAILDSL